MNLSQIPHWVWIAGAVLAFLYFSKGGSGGGGLQSVGGLSGILVPVALWFVQNYLLPKLLPQPGPGPTPAPGPNPSPSPGIDLGDLIRKLLESLLNGNKQISLGVHSPAPETGVKAS